MGGMKLDRLFHVLVVVGGASAPACETDDGEARRPGPEPDAAVDASAAGDGAVEGSPCFCDREVCCDRSAEPARLMTGFTCCWSTTCP
jgi:hypothetical protein